MANNSGSRSNNLIAPVWHTVIMVLLALVPLVSGYIVQNRKTPNNQIFASHSAVMLRFYVPVLIFEWLMVLYIWAGIRKRGVTIKSLIGGRWQSAKSVAIDIGLGVAMWFAMLVVGAILGKLLGPSHAKGTSVIFPEGLFEIVVWIAVSSTAGFVEEFAYRGYLQTQFARMGLPISFAVFAQAVIFSLGHLYEGRNAVISIVVIGIMFGFLAAWRKSLRPGMVGHVAYDAIVPFLVRLTTR